MKGKGNKNILFVGVSNFPYGFAEVQRMILLSRAFKEAGHDVTVLSYKITFDKGIFKYPLKGTIQGIDYVHSGFKPYQPKNIILKYIYKTLNIFKELLHIVKLYRKKDIKILFISSKDLIHTILYYVIAKLIGIGVILNYVEYLASFKKLGGLRTLINLSLFERITYRLSDAIIPISGFLESVLLEKKYKGIIVKIPVICDVERFSVSTKIINEKYFCYCGSTNYEEVVYFVINSFKKISNLNNYNLHLVISGDKEKVIDDLRDFINSDKEYRNHIKLFTHISDEELQALFINAKALLIPLRDTIQDIARFPHKIGEYTATGNPIITTNVGEIKKYFTDNENALIADNYSVQLFKEKMEKVINNEKEVQEIGLKGKTCCYTYFDYKAYRNELDSLINKLC